MLSPRVAVLALFVMLSACNAASGPATVANTSEPMTYRSLAAPSAASTPPRRARWSRSINPTMDPEIRRLMIGRSTPMIRRATWRDAAISRRTASAAAGARARKRRQRWRIFGVCRRGRTGTGLTIDPRVGLSKDGSRSRNRSPLGPRRRHAVARNCPNVQPSPRRLPSRNRLWASRIARNRMGRIEGVGRRTLAALTYRRRRRFLAALCALFTFDARLTRGRSARRRDVLFLGVRDTGVFLFAPLQKA